METKMSPKDKVKQLRQVRAKANEFTVYVNTVSLDLYLLEGLEEAISSEITSIVGVSNDSEGVTFTNIPPFVSLSKALSERNHRFVESINESCILSYINDAVLANIDKFQTVKSVEEHFFI